MTKLAVRQNNIGGFMPSVHNVQSGEVRVIRGRNFRWHFDGPFSGFGNRVVSQRFPQNDYPYYGLFHLDDQSILCTPNGIYQQDCDNCWSLVKPLSPATNLVCAEYDYPWSTAFVGDDYFFSHPLVGIVKFSRSKAEWSCVQFECCGGDAGSDNVNAAQTEPQFYDFESPACVNTNPVFGITEAGNRLIVLSRDTIGHSAIDAGCLLECDPFCGGGFVSSSIAKYGRPLGVYKTLNGFAAFTSNGIVQGRNIDSIGAFSYSLTSSKTFPINPWAITPIGEGMEIAFLSKAGLRIAALNRETLIIQPFEIEMSSWLCEKELFRNAYLHNQHAVALFYSEDTLELFVSLIPHRSQSLPKNVYSRSLVFNTKYKKWSSFDQPHYVIGPVNGVHHRMNDYTLGFFGLDQALHWFNEASGNQYYAATGETRWSSLNSFVAIGPFAMGSEEEIDMRSEISRIKIYTEGQKPFVNITEKTEERPNLGLEDDNYQDQLSHSFRGQVSVYSSDDGYAGVTAEEAVKTLPTTASAFAQTYSCQSTALYHTVVIEGNGVSGYYAVKRIDVKLLSNGTL